jgi:hypothetical protein
MKKVHTIHVIERPISLSKRKITHYDYLEFKIVSWCQNPKVVPIYFFLNYIFIVGKSNKSTNELSILK